MVTFCRKKYNHKVWKKCKFQKMPPPWRRRQMTVEKVIFETHRQRRTCADAGDTYRAKKCVRVAIWHENALFCDGVNPKEGCRSVAKPHSDEPLLCSVSSFSTRSYPRHDGGGRRFYWPRYTPPARRRSLTASEPQSSPQAAGTKALEAGGGRWDASPLSSGGRAGSSE